MEKIIEMRLVAHSMYNEETTEKIVSNLRNIKSFRYEPTEYTIYMDLIEKETDNNARKTEVELALKKVLPEEFHQFIQYGIFFNILHVSDMILAIKL